MAAVDESARQRFETARRAGDDEDLEAFLPAVGDPRRLATLVELLCIEREFQWKEHAQDGAAPPPPLDALLERFPALGDDDRSTVVDEEAGLVDRFGGGDDATRCERASSHAADSARTQVLGESGSAGWTFADRVGAVPAVNPGSQIGRYEVRSLLGRGGFAQVWRAYDPKLKREIALKLTRADLADCSEQTERVRREAQSAARLQHPAIVPVYEVGEHGGCPYIVSGLLPGPDLAAALRKGRPDPDRAVRMVLRLAHAVEYAHQCGIVHRDIKPANILLDDDEEPVLTDFGLAHQDDAEVSMTQEGDLLGTPGYMSPEQARGEKDVDARSDVYALGVVLYEMLCGGRPFASATAAEVIYKKLHEEPVAPRRVDSDIPRDLETVVLTAMAREPDRRYATAGRLADDLERFLDRRPIEARRRGVFGRMGLWCRRNPALAASIFVGVVVSGSIAAVGLNEVLHERDLAREQRDAAHDHLYRSLVNEAAARVAAKETAWRSRVLDNLRRAATSPSSTRDPVELRTLAAKCFSQRQPSFRMLGKWSTEHGFPTALAWSPDGSLIAIARRDGQVDLRDAETGVNRAQCIGAERAVYGLAFHPGGRWLVAGGFDGRLRFYDVTEVDEESAGGSTELAAVKTVAAEGYSFTTLSWSPDGTRLAAGIGHQSARCPVFLFTMHGDTLPAGVEEVGAPKGTLPLVSKTRQLAGHTRAINCVAFSADGLQLGTGGRDSAVSVWEVETGRLQGVWSVSDPPRAIVSVGRTWVASTLENAGCLVITPGNTPPLVNRPGLHDGGVSRILRMPQGWLLTCGDDGLLQCWDSRLNPLGVARGRSGALRTLAVSPDGARVIAGARDHLQMWAVDASDGSDTMSTGHVARFVPGTRTLVTSTTVRDFDDDGPGRSRYLTAPGLRGIHAAGSAHVVVLRRDGKLQIMAARGESRLVEVDGGLVRDLVVEAAGEQAIAVMEDESVVVLRLPDAEVVARRVPATPVQAVAWAGSDQIIIADDRGVELRDAMLENPRPILPGPRRNMRLAGTTDRIAVAATAQEALVINLGDAKIQQRLTTSDVASLSWLDDDAWLAVCEPDRVRLFDGQTWEARTYLAARPIEPKWVALDVDAGLLVTGGTYATLVVWDFEEQYEILELHVRATTNAAFVRDGRALIAASQLGAATGWTRRTLLAAARRMRRAHDDGVATSPPRPTPDVTLISGGHVSQVWATAPSPDGIHVATGSHDGVVKLWSLNGDRPELLKDLRGHRSIAWCTTFSNDGRWLFSGSGEVIRWDVEKRVESMRLPSRRSLVAGITAHPSEPWIAFGRLDGRLEIWRYDEEQSARVLKGPGPGNLRQIAITRDGRRLAVAAGDAGLFLYDLMTPEFRAWLSGASVVPPAPTKRVASPHGASIDAVTWSPDATRLVIGDIEGHVVVTDAATHTRWVTLQTVPTAVRSLDYDQTGRYLAAGIGSASATTWDFDRLQRLWRELGIDP